MAVVMAGGKGSRLAPLTEIRAKPAMYFGGKYRIIDFALSNCVNSDIKKIAVVTQYRAHSLISHIFKAWGFLNAGMTGYMEILPASQQHDDSMWYRGTADSIAQNLNFIKGRREKYTLILAGDHIYKMDYRVMLEHHIESGARCTVGCVVVPQSEAKGFGVMGIDRNSKVVSFVEKPDIPPTIPGDGKHSLASMGIYLFHTDYLIEALQNDFKQADSSHDFGKDIIPAIVRSGEASAHPFPLSCVKSSPDALDYWKDVGTLDSYWDANLELTSPLPSFDLYDRNWPIQSAQSSFHPCKFLYNDDNRRGYATDSILSSGCIISGGYINRSVLFRGVRVNSFSEVSDSILLPGVNIGRNCKISKAIIEKKCVIPEGMVIGVNKEEDAKRFTISENGVTIVTPRMLL